MNKGTLIITSLQVVDGIPPMHRTDPNRYNASRVLSYKLIYKACKIEGYIGEQKVTFYSPTIEFTQRVGMLNFITVNKNNWFAVNDGESTTYKGHPMFDGGSTPNVAFDSHSKIVCLVSAENSYNISYKVKSEINNKQILNFVKILND